MDGKFKELGQALKAEFPFDADWRNLNHGSFGSFPNFIRDKRRHYQDLYEARPDSFIKVEIVKLVDESRSAVAKLINAPVETVVFVSNSTEAVNTVLRNLTWDNDGNDTIINFNTIYDACARAEDFIVDYHKGKVFVKEIPLEYPLEDEEILVKFRTTVQQLQSEGRRAKLALFDVVTSNPGVLFPWESMVEICRELGVMSLVDGAQGIGMVHLNLTKSNPDFFVSNCHKWLYVPRGSAVFHVPVRNQHLIPSTLATARGYKPQRNNREERTQPMPEANGKSHFVMNFEWVGTKDDSAYICVKDAIDWRRDVLGGEDRILNYLWDLNKSGISRMSEILGTPYLENKAGTLRNCAMANIALPIWVGDKDCTSLAPGNTVLSTEESVAAFNWIQNTLLNDYNTFITVFVRWSRFWVRMSSQVYLGLEDYEWAGKVMKELCDRVSKREFLQEH